MGWFMLRKNCHADQCYWRCDLQRSLCMPTCSFALASASFGYTLLQMVYQRMEQQAAAEAEDDDSGERAALEAEEMTLLKVPYQALCLPYSCTYLSKAMTTHYLDPAGRRASMLCGSYCLCGQPPCCQHHLSVLLAWETPAIHRIRYG